MASTGRLGEDAILPAQSPLGPWYCALRDATSGGEVVALANDFIHQWGPDQLAALPGGCRPWRMSALSDIDLYAYLLSSSGRADEGRGTALGLMLSFFNAASARLNQLSQWTAIR